MNKELLQLFDIKDDDVEFLTIKNRITKSILDLNHLENIVLTVAAYISLVKVIKKITGVYTHK